MEKQILVDLLNSLLKPLGFKKKGNKWILDNGEPIIKTIDLQKSYYSRSYYINYGYIIRNLKLESDEIDHAGGRLGSKNRTEQDYITSLLDLDFNILDYERLRVLQNFIEIKILEEFNTIRSEEDLKQLLLDKHILIQRTVMNYFNIMYEDGKYLSKK